ncbi:signal peptidase II [Bacillus cereus group sp. BfR-BA-01453]|uniref:signal peptidase II n=1 Tax=Bacillus cereus group sp. BfR-BA-01453 TaxID=2920355 RepID=UPI001F57A575|nr:signal peptidase II [Bacillus cereus group sp. BfR-BA-01453]
MANKGRHVKVKIWSVRVFIILLFTVSAITLSQGVVHVQDIVKERFFTEKKSEKVYEETINYGDTEDYGTPIEKKKVGDNGERTTTGKKFKGFEKKSSWGDIFSVLSNAWISVVFYVIIAVVILYAFYKLTRKKAKKSEIEQDKQSITKENTDRTEKNKKVKQQFEQPLPKDTIRKTLVEWERTLPFHEQRRSYETMQQWLKRISRTRNITSLYESVRYGEKAYTELDVEKIMKWVEGDGKVDM